MKSKNGFLLAEVMIVLALFMFVSGLTFSLTKVFGRMIMRQEIDFFIQLIRAEQMQAIATQKDRTILFDVENKAYVCDGQRIELSPHIAFCAPKDALGPPSSPKNQIQNYVTFQNAVLTLFSTGAISSGILYLGSSDYNSYYAISIGITALGFVRVYRYENGKWNKL